jgi:hypothetical protein
MWRLVGLVRTGVSEDLIASIFRVERLFDVGIRLAVSVILENSILTRPTRRHIPEDGVL